MFFEFENENKYEFENLEKIASPPSSFIQKSLLRQEKLKQKEEERKKQTGLNNSSSNNILSASEFKKISISKSPKTTQLSFKSVPTNTNKYTPNYSQQVAELKPDKKKIINFGGVSSASSPSKTLLKIQKLEEARKFRRLNQNKEKSKFVGLNQSEIEYKQIEDLLFKVKKDCDANYFKNSVDDSSAYNEGSSKGSGIVVCVRIRPLNEKETLSQNFDIIQASAGKFPNARIFLHLPKIKLNLEKTIETNKFNFDQIYTKNESNLDIYNGSGKTHTIFGDDFNPGIYLLACKEIIKKNAKMQLLKVKFFEIYSSKIFDLFQERKKLELLEDSKGNSIVFGLTEVTVKNFKEFKNLVEIGRKSRTTGSTEANSQSSRSHAVFQISLVEESTNEVKGQFSFCDLAGSEKGSETGNYTSKKSRIEGAEINKSLLALKECIRALYKEKNSSSNIAEGSHIPFRGSKLTQILKDSFIGKKSKTVMIATVGPGSTYAEHTLNTLRYADRVKELKITKKVKQTNQNYKISTDDAEEEDHNYEDESEEYFIEQEDCESELNQPEDSSEELLSDEESSGVEDDVDKRISGLLSENKNEKFLKKLNSVKRCNLQKTNLQDLIKNIKEKDDKLDVEEVSFEIVENEKLKGKGNSELTNYEEEDLVDNEVWVQGKSLIQEHSESVDGLLEVLRIEEELLKKLLNGEINLPLYKKELTTLLKERILNSNK
ncbi:hypothetical protein HDU92_007491, partial [Lobulomyces angularis]